jgi:hypothetical protein
MAIPDTSPVSLLAVQAEVSASSLLTSHSAANAGTFDPQYAVTGNSLYEFRNYGGAGPGYSTSMYYAFTYGGTTYQLDGLTNGQVKCIYDEYVSQGGTASGVFMYHFNPLAVGVESVSDSSPYGPVGLANSDVFVQVGGANLIRLPSTIVTEVTAMSSITPVCNIPNVLKTDLFGLWGMTDVAVGICPEFTGLSANATDLGTISKGVSGLSNIGTCYQFTGSGNLRVVPNARFTALNSNTNDYSFAVWVNTSNPGASTRLMEYRPSNVSGYPVSMQMGSALDMLVTISGSSTKYVTVPHETVFEGSWNHVLMVVTANSLITAYINGSVYGTISISGSGNSNRTGNYFTIGGTSTGSGRVSAKMQQLAVWDRALDSDDASALYNSGNGLNYSNWN